MRSGALRIDEPRASQRLATSRPRSLFRCIVKPKKEAKREDDDEEWPGQKAALEESFNTV